MNRRSVFALLMLLLSFVIPKPSSGGEERQSAQQFRKTIEVKLDYLLYLPKDYDSSESWPLVVFLHGAGERGSDLELVKKHGPPKLVEGGKDFPFILVSPQCPVNKWWEPAELSALITGVCEQNKVDQDRICITGLSMGGFGTWGLAAYEPNRFAALAPICGGGDASLTRRYRHVPVWAFHGAKDSAVPVERTQEMIDALKEHGASPKVTIYPEANHDSWTETYNNPEFYEWLLAQKRTAPAASK
jgi:predicted peptidase